MANALTYVELNPVTKTQEKVDFKWICPYSSRIAEHQAGILNSYGVSIVALLDNGNFNNQLQEHCENIKELNYSFTKITNLHSTLLGIFDGNVRISNAKFDELVYEAIQCYIQARRPQSMKLTFDQLRPGTWRNGKKRKQVSGCGDGTVIATGDISGDNKRFCDLGYELAEHLKKELDYIFDDDFERKFPTMWSTLGYFDYYEDFLISNSMCEAFQTMKSLGISYEVKKLNFVSKELCKIWHAIENLLLYTIIFSILILLSLKSNFRAKLMFSNSWYFIDHKFLTSCTCRVACLKSSIFAKLS